VKTNYFKKNFKRKWCIHSFRFL